MTSYRDAWLGTSETTAASSSWEFRPTDQPSLRTQSPLKGFSDVGREGEPALWRLTCSRGTWEAGTRVVLETQIQNQSWCNHETSSQSQTPQISNPQPKPVQAKTSTHHPGAGSPQGAITHCTVGLRARLRSHPFLTTCICGTECEIRWWLHSLCCRWAYGEQKEACRSSRALWPGD